MNSLRQSAKFTFLKGARKFLAPFFTILHAQPSILYFAMHLYRTDLPIFYPDEQPGGVYHGADQIRAGENPDREPAGIGADLPKAPPIQGGIYHSVLPAYRQFHITLSRRPH